MGSCSSTHYDIYIVSVNGIDTSVHRTKQEADAYARLLVQKVNIRVRHLVVDRRTGLVMTVR
jgi:hypothetical protein